MKMLEYNDCNCQSFLVLKTIRNDADIMTFFFRTQTYLEDKQQKIANIKTNMFSF